MKSTYILRGVCRCFAMSLLILLSMIQAGIVAKAAVINFSTPANCSADTDIKPGGGIQLAAYSWGAPGSITINGMTFNRPTVINGLLGSSIILSSTFTQTNGTAFFTNGAPFNALSAAYTNFLRGAVFKSTAPVNATGTVSLTNLIVGHTYFIQLWVSDPRGANSNRVEYVSSGGGPASLLRYNSTGAPLGGGVGQFSYAIFTADSTSQDISVDAASPTSPDTGALQLNAIQLRDMTGVWSGTTDGTWNNSDTTSLNWSGTNYSYTAGVTTNVYFGNLDASGAAVANTSITVGSGGVTGANVIFNGSTSAYSFSSADANGIFGAYGVTVNTTNTVTFNGANTYTGDTTLNAGTLAIGNSSALGGSANLVLVGGTLDASAAALALNSGQTIRGSGTIKGNVTAAAGSAITLGGGTGATGAITVTTNLTLDGQAFTFDVGISSSAPADKLVVGGVLTLNNNSVITLNKLSSLMVNGTYTLMTFASKSGFGTFSLNAAYPGITLNNNATSVTLTVSGGLAGTLYTWTNNLGSAPWTSATNWLAGSIATNTDGIADFSSLNITSARTVTVGSTNITIGNMLFGDTMQDSNWTLSGGTNTLAVSSGSPLIVVNDPAQNTTISSTLLGNQGLTKLGSGTLTVSGVNKLLGNINVNAGTLATSVGAFLNSTNLDSSAVAITLSNATLTLGGAFKYTNNLVLAAGTTNTLNLNNVNTYLYGTAAGPVTGAGTVIVNVGGTTPKINGGANHNFTGTMIVNGSANAGILFAFDETLGAPGYGYAGSSNAIYEFDGGSGTLNYMATSAWASGATNYLGELRGNAAIYANNGRSGITTLEIGGRNTDSTFSGPIKNAGSAGGSTTTAVRKVGSGTLTLSGGSTYTSPTEVRSGGLSVSGSLAATPVTVLSGATFQVSGSVASPTITVNSGGNFTLGNGASLGSATITLNGLMDVSAWSGGFSLGSASLSGSGVITGAVTVAGTTLTPGTIGGAGTLTITNGDFTANGGTMQFDLSSSPGGGNDFLAVNGNLNFNTSGVTVSINKMSGTLGGGTYVLAKCSGGGTINGSVGNLTLVGAGPLDSLQVNGNELDLVVSPVTILTWTGNGGGNLWDIGSSVTWLNNTTPSTYADGNGVNFNNTGGTNPIVNIPVTVAPVLITVSGSTNYTFVGVGDITDGTSIIKTNSSTLTVLNTNSFLGTVFVNGGTLAIGNAGTNGSLAAPIANNAALVFTTPLDQTASNLVSGSGTFTKQGAGNLTMTANSTLTGPITVTAGTLTVGDGVSTTGSLGMGTVTNNATLAINRASSFTMSNAVRNAGALMNIAAGPVTLSGTISGTGFITNTATAGTLTLAASNSYSGGTFISGGNVTLQNFSGFGSGSVVFDDFAGSSALQIVPTSSTNVIVNNIRLPQAGTPQFVASGVSLTTMGTVRLTGVLSGGQAGTDTPIVNGGGIPAGNPRITIILENPANSFTMTPNVNSGCLAFISDGALGDVNNGITVRSTANYPGSGFTEAVNLVGLRFDANNITLNPNRAINLVGNEILNVQTNNGTIAGGITGLGINKLGTGTLTLSGSNSLTGNITVNAGTLVVASNTGCALITANSGTMLSGTGAIAGNVNIGSGATLSLGTPGVATLTMTTNNTLQFLAGSTVSMKINAASVTSDRVANIGTVYYGGTLTVTNVAGTLAPGQSYQLFTGNYYSGNFVVTNLPSLASLPGYHWNWNPANGSISIVPSVNTTPTNLVATVSGSTLTLSWPADHLGWHLQQQTNSLITGLGTNWVTIPGSDTMTSTNVTIDSSKPTVFYRMVYP